MMFARLPSCGLVVCCCLALCVFVSSASQQDDIEVCERETFRASCPYNEVVVMTSALYGRMELGRCAQVDMGYLGCNKDVLELADSKCSGRRSCDILIPDDDFELTQPCYELKNFLKARYTCTKVLNADSRVCGDTQYLRTPDKAGYIASLAPPDGLVWCDTGVIPWLIEALPGQRINITLYDFSVGSMAPAAPDYSHVVGDVEICERYAVIRESSGDRETVVCRGRERISQVHLSTSNRVVIRMEPQSDGPRLYFMFHYEVLGCPDPEVPPDVHSKRDDNVIDLGCHTSDQSWQLRCNGERWVGTHQNCTRGEGSVGSIYDAATGKLSKRSLIVILCAVGAVVALAFNLIAALLYRRWKKRRRAPHMVEVPTISPISSPVKKFSCPDVEFIEDEDDVYLKPAPNFNSHHHHHHHHHHQFSPQHPALEPLKPLPLPAKTNDYTDRRKKKTDAPNPPIKLTDRKITKCKNDYTHIWEMPLPTPGEA